MGHEERMGIKRAQGRARVDHLEPRELNGTLPSYLQAVESTTGTWLKTDRLETVSPLVSTPHT